MYIYAGNRRYFLSSTEEIYRWWFWWLFTSFL